MIRSDIRSPTSDFSARLLRDASFWILFGALIYAPWAYGSVTTPAMRLLNVILGAAVACRLLAYAIRASAPRRLTSDLGPPSSAEAATAGRLSSDLSPLTSDLPPSPELLRRAGRPLTSDIRLPTSDSILPRLFLVAAVALLAIGWWMTLSAPYIYDSDFFVFIPRTSRLGFGRGSVDFAISVASLTRATLMLGVVAIGAEIVAKSAWLLRLWWTIAIAGGSIALLGLMQKATGADMIFWGHAPAQKITTFFATYYYHANAGAYLNLTWPAAVAFAARNFLRPCGPVVRASSVTLAVLLVVATMANTSKMGQAVSAVLAVAIIFTFRDIIFAAVRGGDAKKLTIGTLALITALIAIAGASRLDQPIARWQQFSAHLPHDARWSAARVALRALPDAGLFGFGPGTFRVIFPYYTAGMSAGDAGIWWFLHEDYLQTLIEWGVIGAALWGVVLFGGIANGARKLWARENRQRLRMTHRLFLTAAVLSLIGVALHAFVDFPLQIASVQLYVAVFLGVAWARGPRTEDG